MTSLNSLSPFWLWLCVSQWACAPVCDLVSSFLIVSFEKPFTVLNSTSIGRADLMDFRGKVDHFDSDACDSRRVDS